MQRFDADAHSRAITNARREQVSAAERYCQDQHPLAELGMGDWFAEEFILTQEQPL
jgi:hypothetical protein